MTVDTSRSEVWNWQCWRVLKKTREWVGFFEHEKDALAWVKSQAGTFVINNVPPSGRTSTGRKTDATQWKTPILDNVTSIKTARIDRTGKKSTAPKVVCAKRALTPEEQALKADAARIFAEHKAAEAAEFEEG